METYKRGDIIEGKVTGIENYGIFVSLDNGVTGLIHISEISNSFVRNVLDYASIGEMIRAVVIDIDSSTNKLKLSIKNMNYRENSKNSCKIVETKTGFSNLKKSLGRWIEIKEQELEEKNKKNNK